MASKNLSAKEIATNTIKRRKLLRNADHLILMVSGGSDSVALAYIMHEIFGNKITTMHLDHNLRDNSKEDAKFVEGLAKHLGVNFKLYSEDIAKIAYERRQNLEACGHDIRYELANQLANTIEGNVIICTAHTADDRIENFYMRSIVGTGPGGFASISYENDKVVRPLLDCPKESLVKYIANFPNSYKDEDGNLWHEDITNEDTDRFRAYVRHEIIPLAKKQNPKVIDNLCNSMNLIADESEYIEGQVKKVLDKYIEINDSSFTIKPGFNSEELVLKRRAIYNTLLEVFKPGTRVETRSINSILASTEQSNYTANIQENYSVHSNKNGVLVQPMDNYRKSRNRL